MTFHDYDTLREKCQYSELFWSVNSRIRTEYGEIYQNSSKYGHSSRSDNDNDAEKDDKSTFA